MLRQIERSVQNGPITKSGVLSLTTFFSKFNLNLSLENIWFNLPITQISIFIPFSFHKRLSFESMFFLWVFLNYGKQLSCCYKLSIVTFEILADISLTFICKHFSAMLFHEDERVYCTPINRALKTQFNEGSAKFLRPARINCVVFWTNKVYKYKNILIDFPSQNKSLKPTKSTKKLIWI